MTNKINDGGSLVIKDAAGIHQNIATDVFPNGATVKCNNCGSERELTRADCAVALRHGWPMCCGYAMTLEARESSETELKAQSIQTAVEKQLEDDLISGRVSFLSGDGIVPGSLRIAKEQP